MIILGFNQQFNAIIDNWLEKESTVYFIYYLSKFLLSFISSLYICIKTYKVICYSKMTCEWLPMINPYLWPFSLFNLASKPYFSFWSTILPSIKFSQSSIEISSIVGLEALTSLVYFCVRISEFLNAFIQEMETTDQIINLLKN
jgi:hypothetical protein